MKLRRDDQRLSCGFTRSAQTDTAIEQEATTTQHFRTNVLYFQHNQSLAVCRICRGRRAETGDICVTATGKEHRQVTIRDYRRHATHSARIPVAFVGFVARHYLPNATRVDNTFWYNKGLIQCSDFPHATPAAAERSPFYWSKNVDCY